MANTVHGVAKKYIIGKGVNIMEDKKNNSIVAGTDDFCNVDYDDERAYYQHADKTDIEAINNYYEKNFLDDFEKCIKTE